MIAVIRLMFQLSLMMSAGRIQFHGNNRAGQFESAGMALIIVITP